MTLSVVDFFNFWLMKFFVLLYTHSRFAARFFHTVQYAPDLFESFINYQRMYSALRIPRLFSAIFLFHRLNICHYVFPLFAAWTIFFFLLFYLIYYLLFLAVICCLSLIKFWISQNIYLNHSSFSCFHLTLTVLFSLYTSSAISWDYLEFSSLDIFFPCFLVFPYSRLHLLSPLLLLSCAILNYWHVSKIHTANSFYFGLTLKLHFRRGGRW